MFAVGATSLFSLAAGNSPAPIWWVLAGVLTVAGAALMVWELVQVARRTKQVAAAEDREDDVELPVSRFQPEDQPNRPLQTPSKTNLPHPASSFVGRQRERDELIALLRSDAH